MMEFSTKSIQQKPIIRGSENSIRQQNRIIQGILEFNVQILSVCSIGESKNKMSRSKKTKNASLKTYKENIKRKAKYI